MVYELREYRIRKGKMKQWLKLFEEEILPFQVERGMVIAGSFTAVKKPELFVWLRRFKNEAERVRLYKRVYETERWEKLIQPRVREVMDTSSIVVTQLTPTPKSVLQ